MNDSTLDSYAKQRQRQQAVDALRARGVEPANINALLDLRSPAQIMVACARFDAKQREEKVGAGLLVKWLREGDFPEPPPRRIPRTEMHEIRWNDEVIKRYPVGAAVEWHATIVRRRYPEDVREAIATGEDLCDGEMIVTANAFPILAMECDRCGWEAAHTPSSLHTIERDRVKATDA